MTATREARALGYARVVLGMIFLARTTPLLSFVGGPFGAQAYPLLGWPTAEWTLAFPGASLPAWLVASLCVLRTVAAVLFACGVRARIAGVVAAGCGYLVAAQDRFAFISSFHVLFLATFVIALTSAPSTVALVPDREAHGEVDSSVRFVSVVLASIYFWAGLAKLQPDWLSGHALLAQARAGAFAGPLGALLERAPLRVVGSLAVPVLELAVAALLLAGRRRPAILLGLFFHLIVELTVKPDMLGWQMAVLLLAIWPRPTETVAAKRPEITEQVCETCRRRHARPRGGCAAIRRDPRATPSRWTTHTVIGLWPTRRNAPGSTTPFPHGRSACGSSGNEVSPLSRTTTSQLACISAGHGPRDRYLELAPKYWATTRARLDPAEFEREQGVLTVPPPAAAQVTTAR